MAAGRPLKIKSAEEMQAKIDEYFAMCNDENPPLVSGLAYHLDMNTESLRRYSADEQFYATVKRAKQRVEMYLEKRLQQQSPVGSIFSLKNNFGWKDKTEQELSGPDGGPIKNDWTVRLVDARDDTTG
jgi:hypothetical protein